MKDEAQAKRWHDVMTDEYQGLISESEIGKGPLVKTYCIECHNATKKKAGLDLKKFKTEKDALAHSELWEQVGERLRTKNCRRD